MISAEHYCSSCGAANPPEASLCFSCGLSLKITTPLSQDIANSHLLHRRYRILTQVGEGGFSAVYKAEDTQQSNHLVAIKAVTLRDLKPHEMIEATDAFNREMLVLSDLNHSCLPHIYDHFSETECWYMVMDFIEGITLEKYLNKRQDGQIPVGEVLEIGIALCTVLEYLHTRQPAIIFRDLKPANVMLKPDGHLALIDFGIARQFKPGQAKDTIPFGSPGYAPPEQYGKAQTTPRTDIYSLGVMLHQMLTGDDPSQSPFRFASLQLEDPSTLAGLESLIMQMVEMDADKRPADITVVKQELQRIAREWSTRYRQGLKVNGPYTRQPPTAFWQVFLPPDQTPGVPTMSGGGGQISLSQQPNPGTGDTSTISAYRSMYAPKKRNALAFVSLILGIIGVLLPILFYRFHSDLHFGAHTSHFAYLLLLVLLAGPSMLAIIFGHIGKRRANTIPGLLKSEKIAVMGIILGYAFCILYSGFICLLFLLSI